MQRLCIYQLIYHSPIGKYTIPSDPHTMKDEGFEPSKYGL